MASGKITPRQKMINMMYLVLTALLALNISKEVLNAFVLVNESLVTSKQNLTGKNDVTYQEFEKAMINDAVKTKPYYDKAKQVKVLADSMTSYLEQKKDILIRKVEKIKDGLPTPDLMEVGAKDNYDVPTNYMCGSENNGKGHEAEALKNKLIDFKAKIIQILGNDPDKDGFKKSLDVSLRTTDPPKPIEGKSTWEMENFYHIPLAAAEVLLTKFQNDIKNSESAVVDHLLNSISKADFKFDQVTARVVAPTSYVLLGQEYSADIFVAAYSSTQKPEIWLGQFDTVSNKFMGSIDSISVKTEGGIGKYTTHPSTEGPQKWGGVIRVKNPATNVIKQYPFRSEYIAAKPALVISPDSMNVFYIGVDNPVSISVPGIPSENVTPSITNGATIKGARGKYIVNVTTPGETTISVNAKLSERENKPMGSLKFRVKRIPPPIAKVADMVGGNIDKAKLQIQYGVIPVLENFAFNAKFTVVSFDFEYTKGADNFSKSNPSSGAFTQEMKDVLAKLPPSSKVYFSNIKVKGPDGLIRPINGINFKLM
jgi:gliding motility-associated protein GldM